MAGIEALDPPTSNQFQYYGTDVPPERIAVGRTFLAGAYYEDYRNDRDRTKYEYGREFLREMDELELPYNRVIVTWSTLSSVLAHLDSQWSRNQSMACLQRFQNDERFEIHYPEAEIYERALERFSELDGEGPNVQEFVDYLHLDHIDVSRYVDWDSDFTYFDDLTLLPHGYW